MPGLILTSYNAFFFLLTGSSVPAVMIYSAIILDIAAFLQYKKVWWSFIVGLFAAFLLFAVGLYEHNFSWIGGFPAGIIIGIYYGMRGIFSILCS